MIDETSRRRAIAALAAASSIPQLSATLGFDGFVDEIIRVVDKRQALDQYSYIPSISSFAKRIASAAGQSTNLQLLTQARKLGGNGPIMANALAAFGMKVTYIGNLGYPTLDPVFAPLGQRAEIFSVAEPGHTDALEFEDGKIMLGKHETLGEVNWPNIVKRVGMPVLKERFQLSSLVGFVNWTMLPHTNEIWRQVQAKVLPKRPPAVHQRPFAFFDLADPEKRLREDIQTALRLIEKFNGFYRVILGLNQKEAQEIGAVLGLKHGETSKPAMRELAFGIYQALKIERLVVHPTAYALACDSSGVTLVDGPYCKQPLITTGAGDHFNAGFCLGNLLGLDPELALLLGVSTSGFYVRTGRSPSANDLANFIRGKVPKPRSRST